MAKVFVAFYNAFYDPEDEKKMPAFYESFVRGLKEDGNTIMLGMHKKWGESIGWSDIPEDIKKKIQDFAPDVCFVFNNYYYDLSFLECPVVIAEADSPIYYANPEMLRKKADRLHFLVYDMDSYMLLQSLFQVPKDNIIKIPLFTSVCADSSVESNANISFIGTLFEVGSTYKYRNTAKLMNEQERKEYFEVVHKIEANPYITRNEAIKNCKHENVRNAIDTQAVLFTLSAEKRIHVLSEIADLGLSLYGTDNWVKAYYFHMELNECYIEKNVYSLEHNMQIYNSSRIGISISHMQAVDGFPWRVMDIMASNAVLVSDSHKEFDMLFHGVNIPIYHNRFEAREWCKKLLNDESLRIDIVRRCNEIINDNYTYRHFRGRLEEALNIELHVL